MGKQVRRWTLEEIKYLEEYPKQGIKIAEKICRSSGAVRHKASRLGITKRKPIEVSPELCYLIGAALGDGNICHYQGNYCLRISVRDIDFIKEVNKNVYRILGHPYKVQVRDVNRCPFFTVAIYSKELYRLLSSDFNELGKIVAAYPSNFLRGVFDAEGGVFSSQKKERFYKTIHLSNTSLTLVKLIHNFLDQLGIHSTLTSFKEKPKIIKGLKLLSYPKRCYKLRIYEKESIMKFYKKIGFSIQRKQQITL